MGLDWLKPGVNTIGGGKGCVIAKAPPRLGSIEWNKDTVRLTLNDGSGAQIDGKTSEGAELLGDDHEPTIVSFGTVSFYRINRGDKVGLRIKDSKRKHATNFSDSIIFRSIRVGASRPNGFRSIRRNPSAFPMCSASSNRCRCRARPFSNTMEKPSS